MWAKLKSWFGAEDSAADAARVGDAMSVGDAVLPTQAVPTQAVPTHAVAVPGDAVLSEQDSERLVALCILAMSYDRDPALLPEHCSTAIVDWYGVREFGDLEDVIQQYLAGCGSTPAYDAFRAAFLARAGQAVGAFGEEASWRWMSQALAKVRQSYSDWSSFGEGYLEGHLSYRQSEGDDADTVARYRENLRAKIQELGMGIWAEVPLRTS